MLQTEVTHTYFSVFEIMYAPYTEEDTQLRGGSTLWEHAWWWPLQPLEEFYSRKYNTESCARFRLSMSSTFSKVKDFCLQHVFNSLRQAGKLWSTTTTTITDLEAVNKLLGQLEGGGAVPGPRAYISVLGRYNVGKTTLLNALLSFEWVSCMLLLALC